MDIDLLPDEILTKIFSKMTAKERKPFRIACRRWFDCCNRLEIQKAEKLHLPGVSRLDDMVKTVLTSRRSIMNLKISKHRLGKVDCDLWLQCGSKIKQLELTNCVIGGSTMECILVNCTNLSYLALENVSINCLSYYASQSHDVVYELFNEMNARVVARNVKTLVLNYSGLLNLHTRGLLSMISVFPNVENLELHFESFQDHRNSDRERTCKQVAKHLATDLPKLVNLTMKTERPFLHCKCANSIREFSRLKTFKFYCNRYSQLLSCHSSRVYSVITSSHSEEVMCVQFFHHAKVRKVRDIINVLRKLTSLREVCVDLISVTNFFEFVELYKALADSRLDSVRIRIEHKPEWIGSLREILEDRSLPVNSTVRELEITIEQTEDIFIPIFLKCFSALNRLRLKTLTHENINYTSIFHQTNLKCIELNSKSLFRETDVCILPSWQSINSNLCTENLEYLRIDVGDLRTLLVQQPSIFFANLRFLHIPHSGARYMLNKQVPLTQEELRCIPRHNLEGVYLEVNTSCTSDIFTVFSNPLDFPRIRHIGIRLNYSDLLQYKQWFEPWFKNCPSLTTVLLIPFDTGHPRDPIGFFLCYDPVQGEMREFKPGNTSSYIPVRDFDGKIMYNYLKNVKSFYNFWLDR